jgi:hypothetical protein
MLAGKSERPGRTERFACEVKSATERGMTASSSSIPVGQKGRELARIFAMRLRGVFDRTTVDGVIADVVDYERQLNVHTGRGLRDARVLEIGYGARPLRLFAALAFGAEISGIDLDTPMLAGSPREIIAMWRRNGAERVIKSVIRFTLFDLLERRFLAQALQKRGLKLSVDRSRLLVGDAASLELPPVSFELVYSEDVFEHMPENSIRCLLPKLAGWVDRKGFCLIRPNIFAGITGGHLTDWFTPAEVNACRKRKAEPWEHLRKRRFMPTGYLNGLTRAQYRDLFSVDFEILEERVRYPNLGRQHLSEEIAGELSGFGEEELFSNQVQFVLKPRQGRPPSCRSSTQ